MFNMCNFSFASCPQTMSKRVQEGAGEDIVTAKSKPVMNLVSRTVEKSSMSLSLSASNSPRTLKAQSQNLGLIACGGRPAPKDSNEDAASSSQAWQSDRKLNSSAGRLATTGKTQRVIDRDRPRNFEISACVLGHLQKVYSNFRQKNWSPARGRNA